MLKRGQWCNSGATVVQQSEEVQTGNITSTLADLSVASPEHSDERGSVVRGRPDVAVLSEQDVVPVLHAAEAASTHR